MFEKPMDSGVALQDSLKSQLKAPPEDPIEVQYIDLDRLDDNPFQPRLEVDPDRLAKMRENIRASGQIHPITVRSFGERFQIISGKCRTEAHRQLRDQSSDDADRARYSKIRAEVRRNVSDAEMLTLALFENLHRQDLSPVETADALVKLQIAKSGLEDAIRLSEFVQLPVYKVRRLVRLHAAPAVIRAGAGTGLMVPTSEPADPSAPGDTRTRQQRRTLDVMAALELVKLHDHWAQQASESPTTNVTSDERMAELIKKILTEEWGFRRVESHVADALKAKEPVSETRSSSAAFNDAPRKLVILKDRLPEMKADERDHLKMVLAPIWAQLGGGPARRSSSLFGDFRRWVREFRTWLTQGLPQLLRAGRDLHKALQQEQNKVPTPNSSEQPGASHPAKPSNIPTHASSSRS